MAIFGKKTTKKETTKKPVKAEVVAVSATAVSVPVSSAKSHADVILRPHVTEKSGIMSQNNVYTFQVAKGTNKQTIDKAIRSLYKVNPVKIAVINVPAKQVFVRGKWGKVSGMRKAMVTIAKGEKIEFV